MTGPAVEAVVTYLRLDAAPRRLPVQPAGLKLALMKAERIPLHYYRYLYSTIGRQWLWVERLGLSDEELAGEIHRDGIEILVLYGEGAPAGYFELDFAGGETVSLVYFGLMEDWVGRRVGPWLLGVAVTEALSRGAREVIVNTCTLDHPKALPLYQRFGFVPVGRATRTLVVPDGMPLPRRVAAPTEPEARNK